MQNSQNYLRNPYLLILSCDYSIFFWVNYSYENMMEISGLLPEKGTFYKLFQVFDILRLSNL